MTSKQNQIIGRVQALLTKTVERGCTEAEANDWAINYKSQGFERIPREQAIRKMRYRGDAITEAFVVVEVDGKQVIDRWVYARELKGG